MLWNSNFETGNTLVDSEHKEIFGMVDNLLTGNFAGRADKIKSAVDFLAGYVLRHFGHEEELMSESSYPGTDIHVKQHKDFVVVVTELTKRIEKDIDSIDLSLEVNKIIVNWLAEHVMTSDKAMADHYKNWSVKRKQISPA